MSDLIIYDKAGEKKIGVIPANVPIQRDGKDWYFNAGSNDLSFSLDDISLKYHESAVAKTIQEWIDEVTECKKIYHRFWAVLNWIGEKMVYVTNEMKKEIGYLSSYTTERIFLKKNSNGELCAFKLTPISNENYATLEMICSISYYHPNSIKLLEMIETVIASKKPIEMIDSEPSAKILQKILAEMKNENMVLCDEDNIWSVLITAKKICMQILCYFHDMCTIVVKTHCKKSDYSWVISNPKQTKYSWNKFYTVESVLPEIINILQNQRKYR